MSVSLLTRYSGCPLTPDICQASAVFKWICCNLFEAGSSQRVSADFPEETFGIVGIFVGRREVATRFQEESCHCWRDTSKLCSNLVPLRDIYITLYLCSPWIAIWIDHYLPASSLETRNYLMFRAPFSVFSKHECMFLVSYFEPSQVCRIWLE
jgi:hypothetical protein